nr:integrase arm-type DNA-binding domain-containing protein [Paraburkholderia panacisoli]
MFRVAKPRERPYLLADGNGLVLRIWPDGSKTWLLRCSRPGTGKENFLSLGPYPDITLLDARRSAATARNLVREGTDPVEHRRAAFTARKRAVEGAFHLVAQRWLEFKRKEWADETYRKAEFVVRHTPTRWSIVGLNPCQDGVFARSSGADTVTDTDIPVRYATAFGGPHWRLDPRRI